MHIETHTMPLSLNRVIFEDYGAYEDFVTDSSLEVGPLRVEAVLTPRVSHRKDIELLMDLVDQDPVLTGLKRVKFLVRYDDYGVPLIVPNVAGWEHELRTAYGSALEVVFVREL